MRDLPRGGILGKCQHFVRKIVGLRIPLYAGNACYFLVLSVCPGLLLLLSLLQYTPMDVERLAEALALVLPEPFLEGAEELIYTTYDASYTLVGVSAATALWSASRGIYGLLTGLNGIYGVRESRSWLHRRLLSAGYTIAFLLVAVLTLGLHGMAAGFLKRLPEADAPFFRFLADVVDVRYVLLLLVQTVLFAAMFLALPNRVSTWRDVLPGALLASFGWMAFSRGYEVYLARFAVGGSIYGSVYAVSLSMLWLYFCVCILFCGGGLNALLLRRKER